MEKKSNFLTYTIVFILSGFLVSCSCKDSAKNIDGSKINKYSNFEKIATEKYKSGFSQEFNKSKSFILVSASGFEKQNTANEPLSFFVYNIEKEVVVYEQSFGGGSVKWLNDRQIKVSPILGIVKGNGENESSEYIYDILLKRKINTMNKIQN